jgi:hypothetical protein
MAVGMTSRLGARRSATPTTYDIFSSCPLRARSKTEQRGTSVAHGHAYMTADLATPGRTGDADELLSNESLSLP